MRVALTPNLAVDRILQADSAMQVASVNRVTLIGERAGGKGVNLARAYRALGGEVVVAGFVAGDTGRRLARLLDEEGFDTSFLLEVEGETRTCQIIRHPVGHPTEILERGPRVAADDWRRLAALLPPAPVVVSGSLPGGIEPAEFADLLRAFEGPTTVDTSGAALRAAVEAGVVLVKPNRAELAELCGASEEPFDVATVAATHHRRHGVPLLVTCGSDGAIWVAETSLRVTAPAVVVTNPVASGDTFLGAFLWARDHGLALEEALRIGAASGADNARRGGGGDVTAQGIRRLARRARIEVAT
jgi:1-phosphofructokinase family hexose kinase